MNRANLIHSISTIISHAKHAIAANAAYSALAFALAFGLLGTIALFLSVKREMRSNAARNRRQMDQLARKLEETPRDTEPASLMAAQRSGSNLSAPAISGMNIGKRVQAMRMVRRNQDVSHIAAALGVTRREVELLIRVQRMGTAAIRTAAS